MTADLVDGYSRPPQFEKSLYEVQIPEDSEIGTCLLKVNTHIVDTSLSVATTWRWLTVFVCERWYAADSSHASSVCRGGHCQTCLCLFGRCQLRYKLEEVSLRGGRGGDDFDREHPRHGTVKLLYSKETKAPQHHWYRNCRFGHQKWFGRWSNEYY